MRRFSPLTAIILVLCCAASAPSQERPRRPARNDQPPPTHADVQYGSHRRHVLDFWQAKSDQPTPVLVSIHGGGFRGGNKSIVQFSADELLDAGISIAAITYRLSDVAIAPAQFEDAARAVQFIRSKQREWNIDAERLAATGSSAGAGLSLWLAFHEDLAQPDSDDPVLRQSTRLRCAVVYNGQTSYDPRFIRDLFPESDTYKHPALEQLFDVDSSQLDQLPESKYRLFEQVSSITHLTKDDPPVMLLYNRPADAEITSQGVGIHHPKFGLVLKERMDKLGIPCIVVAGRQPNAPTSMEFLRKHLLTSE